MRKNTKKTDAIIATGENVNGQDIVIVEQAKTFDEVKKEFMRRCKLASACEPEYKKVIAAKNYDELLPVISANISWCVSKKVVDVEYLDREFGAKLLWQHHIYTSGKHSIEVRKDTAIALFGSSSATVKTWDSSSATVKTWDSSSATVETWGSSSATVKTLGSSSATVKTWGSSSATVETWGSSSATVETWDSSSATVETLGSSSATVKTLGSSSATVKTWDSSSATVETWGSSSATVETWGSSSATVKTWGSSSATVETCDSSSKLTYSIGDGYCPTIKHLNERKLYVKTSNFEIVQL